MEDQMLSTTLMQIMFLIWMALVVLTIRRTLAQGSVGLSAAFLIAMSFLYSGCFVYVVPGYTHLRPDANWYLSKFGFSEWDIVQGTFVSLLGVLGFALGCGIFRRPRRRIITSRLVLSQYSRYEKKALTILCAIGATSFALHYMHISFPMSQALFGLGRNLATVAVCLGAYRARRRGKAMTIWVALAFLIPLYYFVAFGHLSYGFIFATIIMSFWLAQVRRKSPMSKLSVPLFSFAAIWLSFTVFVGWFSFRDEARRIIWLKTGDSLWEVTKKAFVETELFSPWNFASLDLINIRFNMSILIGRMMEYHQIFPDLKEWGSTLIVIPLALIPRFIWPDKPATGGSDFVTAHTGIMFSNGTTVGAGSVFEFFVNFGYPGVFFGFIVLGWLISRIDRRAAHHLINGDFFRFSRLFAVGIVAVEPLASPFFIVNGALIAWIMMTFLGRTVFRRPRIIHWQFHNQVVTKGIRKTTQGITFE